jgi:two-component system response regulator DesR
MRVLIADDEAKVRSALRLLLEQESYLEVVGEVGSIEGLLPLVKAIRPQVLLLDWELLGVHGEELVPDLRALRPDLVLVALSGRPEARRTALEAGADAFVSKGDPPESLLASIRYGCACAVSLPEEASNLG